MRKVVLTAAMMLASGTAMASSIDVVHGSRSANNSIVSISCATCPPLTRKPKPQDNPAKTLPDGTQTVSIRDIDGRKETVRTEAWLGGSPVTFISTNPVWLPTDDAPVAADAPAAIDEKTTTAAVKPSPERAEDVADADGRAIDGITALPLRQSP